MLKNRTSRTLMIAMAIALSAFLGGCQSIQTGNTASEADNEQIIRDFVAAWSRLDADELAGYFTEDGTYFNMPLQPVSGRDNVREYIRNFLQSWDKTDWEMVTIVAQDDLVFAERIDRTVIGGRKVDLPCVGVFEMENGRIRVWRDYFDVATFANATRPEEEPAQ